MIQEAISLIVEGNSLDSEMARMVMEEVLRGEATPSQISAFLMGLRMKGETEAELNGFISAMRSSCINIRSPAGAIDLCGTGGDCKNTFNVSTTATFIVAAAGIPVAKHGNRSVSSKSGSYDVLSALNIPVDQGPSEVQRCIDQCGIGFFFAPIFHPAMKNVAQTRKEIGIRTVFNLLGPMVNPAGVKRQLIGVFDFSLAPVMAKVLKGNGLEHFMIVNGGGMDEISICGETAVLEVKGDEFYEYTISPADFGMEEAEPDEICGGTPNENAAIMISILKGEDSPRADMATMNAGAAIYLGGKASNIEEGVWKAREILRSGRAFTALEKFANTLTVLEEEKQKSVTPEKLLDRKLMPAILKSRCDEVVKALHQKLINEEKERLLACINPEIIHRPTVLSILSLTRLLNFEDNQHLLFIPKKASRHLSDAIAEENIISVISEYKPSSPTTPPLMVAPDLEQFISTANENCMAGISVLAESLYFRGGDDLVCRVRAATDLPVLYKDFILAPDQVIAAKRTGVDAVLLIAKSLSYDGLDELVFRCIRSGLEPLVEVHDQKDIEKIECCQCYSSIPLIGVNSRDLDSLGVNLDRLREFKRYIPSDFLKVAESGIRQPEDMKFAEGYDAILIGSYFMGRSDLKNAFSEILNSKMRMKS